MKLEEMRKRVSALSRCNTIPDALELADIFLEYLFKVITDHHGDPVHSQADADANIVHQMMFTKLTHIRKLVEGVGFVSKTGKKMNEIIDPTLVASLVRNVYETVGMFNLVYIAPSTGDEKSLLYSLWVSAGLKYRQRFSVVAKSPISISKLEDEEKIIEGIKLDIENSTLYKGLDSANQARVQKLLKDREYKMRMDSGNIRFLAWWELAEVMGCSPNFFDEIYTYFSLYAHPSNVAVFNFQEMFNKKTEDFIRITLTLLTLCFTLMSIFIADYIRHFPKVITTFSNQPLLDQIMLNLGNMMTRGEKLSINDAWKELGVIEDPH